MDRTQRRIEIPCVLVICDKTAAEQLQDQLVPLPVLEAQEAGEANDLIVNRAPLLVIVGGPAATHMASLVTESCRAVGAEIASSQQLGTGSARLRRVEQLIEECELRRRRK